MERRGIWVLPCVLAAVLLAAGCGQNQPAAQISQSAQGQTGQDQNKQDPAGQKPSEQTVYQAPDQWQLVSKNYAVKGTVQSVRQTGDTVQSVTINVAENIKGAGSSVDSADFPFKAGASQEIVLQVPKQTMSGLVPKQGDDIILTVGQYANVVKGSDQPVWACLFPAGYFKKDGGKYYTLNGDVFGAPAQAPDTSPKPQGPYSPTGGKELLSKLYAVKATISQINMQGSTLHSLGITINENIKGADAAVDDKNYPFPLGSTAEVLFDEALSQQGKLDLKKGDSLQLTVGQFASGNNNQVWGSNFDWVLVSKDGKLYNDKGETVQP
jgi:hypothetical protein